MVLCFILGTNKTHIKVHLANTLVPMAIAFINYQNQYGLGPFSLHDFYSYNYF
jgi:hypothetical protein